MRRHVIENAAYAGSARFPPSTVSRCLSSILEFAQRLFPQMRGQHKTLTPEPLNPKLRAVAQRMQGLNGLLSFSCVAAYVFSIHSDRKDTGNFPKVPLYFYCTTSTGYIGVT